MNHLPFAQPLYLAAALPLVLLSLAFGLWAQLRPGLGVRVVGQRPLLQGLGLALVLAGLGVGLAEPRSGAVEVPRLTVHVVVDASRSMLAPITGVPGASSRWEAARRVLDRLWSRPNPGVRFSLDLLTGDAIPLLPPGEDQTLLRDALKAVIPGDLGSPGTSLGRGLPMVAAQVEAKAPAVMLLLGDGEETWEAQAEALKRATAPLVKARLPLYTMVFGGSQAQGVPGAKPGEPSSTKPNPELMKQLAEATQGQLLEVGDDLSARFQRLAQGHEALPVTRSILPTHPEWGAWLALLGLALWLLAAGGSGHGPEVATPGGQAPPASRGRPDRSPRGPTQAGPGNPDPPAGPGRPFAHAPLAGSGPAPGGPGPVGPGSARRGPGPAGAAAEGAARSQRSRAQPPGPPQGPPAPAPQSQESTAAASPPPQPGGPGGRTGRHPPAHAQEAGPPGGGEGFVGIDLPQRSSAGSAPPR